MMTALGIACTVLAFSNLSSAIYYAWCAPLRRNWLQFSLALANFFLLGAMVLLKVFG